MIVILIWAELDKWWAEFVQLWDELAWAELIGNRLELFGGKEISCRDIRKHGQLVVNNDGLEEFKCAQFLSVTMFLYSVKTLLLYGGGSLLLYLGMAQFITPSKEEEIRKVT